MAKKKIGLALGAGGARGIAHVGVLQVLEENDIHADIIVGTSMGAAVGAIYSCGTDINLMGKLICQFSERDYLDFKIPRKGIIGGQRFEDLLQMFTKNKTFDDLEKVFACVACDIVNAKAVVLDKGDIYKSVRASISIPGVFEPYMIDGTMYVDGAVIDRVPIGTCYDKGADIVIGVDVGYRGEPGKEPRSLIDVVLRTFDIMGWEVAKTKHNRANVMIAPRLNSLSPYTNSNSEEIIRLGRESALQMLPEIKEVVFGGSKSKKTSKAVAAK